MCFRFQVARQVIERGVAQPRLLSPYSMALRRGLGGGRGKQKELTEEQKIGAGVAIGFVLVYSVIDDVIKAMGGGAKDAKKKTK